MLNLSRKFTGTQLSNCAYYPGAKPGKKHALIKQYALNSELHLLTRVYGIIVRIQTRKYTELFTKNTMENFAYVQTVYQASPRRGGEEPGNEAKV